jgi:4-amino-4-deoxy-L-arabinose transferase-like glycosyltransferase
VSNRIDKRDLPWVALIVLSFIFALAVSWERWGNPLVDCGREMNQPLRLARGAMLYSDVRHIYGPLSPYVNALLYRIFDPSLRVLYADGIFAALIILALVYWLSRQLMGRAPSAAATLSVMWLCAFKQAGNYILPYTYSALHGCLFGLASVALLVRFVQKAKSGRQDAEGTKQKAAAAFCFLPSAYWLTGAGVAAGLATLAKTEMGLAAVGTGIIAVALAGHPTARRVLALGAIFISPALLLVIGTYSYIAARVGWHTLAADSFLFLRHLPPELVYFNKRVSGFDDPLSSTLQMIGSALRVGSLAGLVAGVSLVLTWRGGYRTHEPVAKSDLSVSSAGRASFLMICVLLLGSLLVFLFIPFAWETGPYLAMPILLVGLLVTEFASYRRQIPTGATSSRTIITLILLVYALASLARVILRVRSGGAYSSYLLPASVIVFTYAWAHPFADLFRERGTRHVARNIAIGLILADVAITAGLLAHKYRDRNTYALRTDRGTIVAVPDLGQSFDEAISFIKRKTSEGEPVAVVPEGTSLNFFTDRPNPLREEIVTPGYLDREGEARAIGQLAASNTRFVLITNRATPEFGPEVFGKDYCQVLMQWIEQNFEECAIFGPDHSPNQQIGGKTFFIRVYRKRGSEFKS